MARFDLLVSFLTAGAYMYARRVATKHGESGSHSNAYGPLGHPSAIVAPASAQMHKTLVGNSPQFNRHPPGIAMQAPEEYSPGLSDDSQSVHPNHPGQESFYELPVDWQAEVLPAFEPVPDVSADSTRDIEDEQVLGTFDEYSSYADAEHVLQVDFLPSIIKEWTAEAKAEAQEVWGINVANTLVEWAPTETGDREAELWQGVGQENTWKEKMEHVQKRLALMSARIAEQGLHKGSGLETGSSLFKVQEDNRRTNMRESRVRFQPEDNNVLAPTDQRLHVFGLAYQDYDFSDQRLRPGSVQALASLQYSYIEDDTGFLYSLGRGFGGDDVMLQGAGGGYMGQYEAVHVKDVIARPYTSASVDSHPNSIGELLYAIVDWAAFIGKMVTISPENDEEIALYESFGFEFYGGIYKSHAWNKSGSDMVMNNDMVYALQIPTPKQTSGSGLLLDLAD